MTIQKIFKLFGIIIALLTFDVPFGFGQSYGGGVRGGSDGLSIAIGGYMARDTYNRERKDKVFNRTNNVEILNNSSEDEGTRFNQIWHLDFGYTTSNFHFGLRLFKDAINEDATFKANSISSDSDSYHSIAGYGIALGYNFSDIYLGGAYILGGQYKTEIPDSLEANGASTNVENKTKVTGYLIDFAYKFKIGSLAVGPWLVWQNITAKLDYTITTDTQNYANAKETVTGNDKYSRIVPLLGLWLSL